MPVYEIKTTKPTGTWTSVAHGRAVKLTAGEPQTVFLSDAQAATFSNSASVEVTEKAVEEVAEKVAAADPDVQDMAAEMGMAAEEVAAGVRRGAKKAKKSRSEE
jgi:hypothetical protein